MGPGAANLAVDGNAAGRVFHIGSGKIVAISDLTITNGYDVSRGGGGIYNDQSAVTVSYCTISGNRATEGGGILNGSDLAGATLLVANSTLSGNIAGFGGGISSVGSPGSASASVVVTSSTLSSNSAFGRGGGIFNNNAFRANLRIVNSTLSGNSAGAGGGGIDFRGNAVGTLQIVHATFSGNSAAGVGGGAITFEAGTLEIGHTIFTTAASGANIVKFTGTITSLGHNLSSDAAGGDATTDPGGLLNATGDIRNTPPLLGPLQDNGGPTFTHALLSGSPATDAGDPAFVGPPDFDQRGIGFPRVQNGRIDIGAFESAPPAATMTTADSATVQYSDVVTLSATVSPDTAAGSIQFSVGGTPVGSAVAVSGGEAKLNVQVLLAADSYQIKAVFTSSDTGFSDSDGTSVLTVTRENAKVTPRSSNPLAVKVNTAGGTAGPITLCADITEVADGSLGNSTNAAPVTFKLVPVAGGATITQTATVTGGGVGGTLAACVTLSSVPVNVYDITISIGGNYYTGSAETCLAVYDPSLGFVTGGGKVMHNDVPANFAFSAKYLKNGQTQGSLLYIEHRLAGDVVLKSNSMGSLAIVGNTAVLTGKATLNGVGNYGFRATVVDNGDPGTTDQFGLKLTNPSGAVVSDLTFVPLTINGGNIQVPQGKK